MTSQQRMLAALNKLAKWRQVFAGWQLGTRPATDPECRAVRDQVERTLILRAEMTALAGILIDMGICTLEQLQEKVAQEATALDHQIEDLFPGFRTTSCGLDVDTAKAAETTRGWRP